MWVTARTVTALSGKYRHSICSRVWICWHPAFRASHFVAMAGATVCRRGPVGDSWGFTGFWRGAFANYPNVSADYWGWQYGAKPVTDYFKAHPADYDDFVMSGDFNAAYILEEFYMHGSPIASITFTGGLEFLDLDRRQLFAVRVSEWESSKGSQYPARAYLRIVETIDYPNGSPAFYLLSVDPALLHRSDGEQKAPAG